MYVDVFCTVDGQRLKIETPIKHFPRSSEDFVRFLFTFSDDWDGLMIFAQFRQFHQYSNKYLETVTVDGVSYQAVTLPGWPKPGPLTLLLYGTGNETVIGTTNAVLMHIDATGLIDADVSDIDETLYQQLINRIIAVEAQAHGMETANVYSSMEALTEDVGLDEGRVVRTVSFYEGGHIGGAEYEIVAMEQPYTWSIPLANGLYANIREAKVYPEMLGARRDGMTDDSDAIQKAIDTLRPVGLSFGTYAVNPHNTKTRTFYWKEQYWRDPQYPYTVSFKYGFYLPPGCLIEGDKGGASNSTNGSVLKNIGDGYVAWMQGDYRRPSRMERFGISGLGVNDGIVAMLDTDTPDPATNSGCWGGTPVIREFCIRNCRTPICGYSVYLADISQGTIINCGTTVMTYGQYAGNLPAGKTRAAQYTTNNFCNCNKFTNIFFINRIKTAAWKAESGKYYTVDGEPVESDDPQAFWKNGHYILTPPKETTYLNEEGDSLYINDPCVRIDHGSNFIFDNCSFQYNRLGVSCDYVKNMYFKNCHFEGVDFCYYNRINRNARFYGGIYTWLIAYRDTSTAEDRAVVDAVNLPAWVKRLYRYKKSFTSYLTDYGKQQVNLYRTALNLQLQNAGNLSSVASLMSGGVLMKDIYADAAQYGEGGAAAESAVDLARSVHPDGDILSLSTGTPDTFYFAKIGAGESEFNAPLNTKYAASYDSYLVRYDFTSLVQHSQYQGALFDFYCLAYDPGKVYCAKYTMYKWRNLYFISEPEVMRSYEQDIVGRYDADDDDYFYIYVTKPASHHGRLYFMSCKLQPYTNFGYITAGAAVSKSDQVALTSKIDETNMDDYPFVYGVVKTAATNSDTMVIYVSEAGIGNARGNVNINGTTVKVNQASGTDVAGAEWTITLSSAVSAAVGDLVLLKGNTIRTVSGPREIIGAIVNNSVTKLTLNNIVTMDANAPMIFGAGAVRLIKKDNAYKAVVTNPVQSISMTIRYHFDPCPGDIVPRYQIRFVEDNAAGADNDIVASQSRTAGQALLKVSSPQREGYTFVAWYYYDRTDQANPVFTAWNFATTKVAATQAEPGDPYTIKLYATWQKDDDPDTEDNPVLG